IGRPTRCFAFSSTRSSGLVLQLKAFDQRKLVDAIREQLIQANPTSETRNNFALDPPPNCADYELRLGNLRVLNRVEEEAANIKVIVALISRRTAGPGVFWVTLSAGHPSATPRRVSLGKR